jgi:hypothetical protein
VVRGAVHSSYETIIVDSVAVVHNYGRLYNPISTVENLYIATLFDRWKY